MTTLWSLANIHMKACEIPWASEQTNESDTSQLRSAEHLRPRHHNTHPQQLFHQTTVPTFSLPTNPLRHRDFVENAQAQTVIHHLPTMSPEPRMFACRVLAAAVDDAVPDTYAGRHLGWRGGCPGVGGLDRLAEFGLDIGVRKALIVLVACLCSVACRTFCCVLFCGWDGMAFGSRCFRRTRWGFAFGGYARWMEWKAV